MRAAGRRQCASGSRQARSNPERPDLGVDPGAHGHDGSVAPHIQGVHPLAARLVWPVRHDPHQRGAGALAPRDGAAAVPLAGVLLVLTQACSGGSAGQGNCEMAHLVRAQCALPGSKECLPASLPGFLPAPQLPDAS